MASYSFSTFTSSVEATAPLRVGSMASPGGGVSCPLCAARATGASGAADASDATGAGALARTGAARSLPSPRNQSGDQPLRFTIVIGFVEGANGTGMAGSIIQAGSPATILRASDTDVASDTGGGVKESDAYPTETLR